MADQTFIATLRIVFKAPSKVDAELIAEDVRDLVERGALDADDHDEALVTSVSSAHSDLGSEETLVQFRRVRNALISTRLRWMLDVAQELDKARYFIELRDPQQLTRYDYGGFQDVVEQVLKGESPQ